MEKDTHTDYPVLDVIRRRWSPFAFDPDRDVPPDVLHSLLEAARWAPSARNAQPWRFLVLDRSVPEARAKADSCLSEGNAWAKRAPLLLLAVARTSFEGSTEVNQWARYDTGAAILSVILQATSLGLCARQIGAYDQEKAADLLGIPEGFKPATMTAIGYYGATEHLTETQRDTETRPRQRLPVKLLTFAGTWGTPFA